MTKNEVECPHCTPDETCPKCSALAVQDMSQPKLFEELTTDWWEDAWKGMPEFNQGDLSPWKSLIIHFGSREDMAEFALLVEQRIGSRTRSIWYPEAEIGRMSHKRFVTEDGKAPARPRFPLYVVSKGRYDSMLTSKSLTRMGQPHYVVVEERERGLYESAARSVSQHATILVLDPQYQIDYDPCDDLGMTKSKGPGPSRNFAWDHSIESGFDWHWVMDDNIDGFFRLQYNLKTPIITPTFWRVMEDWCLRYENVYMGGPNYFMFASRKTKLPPFVLNTRIYSCNLIRNSIPYRWRGRYNEDTDISLRILKDGFCTVQFNAYLQRKTTTQVLRGGNSGEFYDKEGTLPKSQMQVDLHPDVSRLVKKWGRWHHQVDYSSFKKNALRKRRDCPVYEGSNEYDMTLHVDPETKATKTATPEPVVTTPTLPLIELAEPDDALDVLHQAIETPVATPEPDPDACRVTEVGGTFKCWKHDRIWGVDLDGDPCEKWNGRSNE